ncbi:acyl transferase [Flavobacteriaceae bacterium]|nr:acyl transferase [Flavobacteriaceae bacterium]
MKPIAFTDFDKIAQTEDFDCLALALFHYQFEHNPVYRSYCDLINRGPSEVQTAEAIPFLPIQFFKSHEVRCFSEPPEKIFLSSSTTGQIPSRHFVRSLRPYHQSFEKAFELFYGAVENYVVLALLPSYLEREASSLVHMAATLIEKSQHSESGFYLNNYAALAEVLKRLEDRKQKTLLLGVSFALLEMAEKFPLALSNTLIMETGGMKGRGEEMVRTQLHQKLKNSFGVSEIHSEYGMTELLSQAYSSSGGVFECPPWMKIFIRSTEDPFDLLPDHRVGGINIIDLANIDSCAFIATQDLGKKAADGSFEILGRFDAAEIRGCNLLVL